MSFASYRESLPRHIPFQLRDLSVRPWIATIRARMAWRKNRFYVKSEKLLALLLSGGAKRILFSEMPEWMEDIKSGFRHLAHQAEFGRITEDAFEQYDIVVPLDLSALEDARRYSPQKKNTLPLPSAESVHLCDDKYEFNEAVTRAGFGRFIPRMVKGFGLKPPYILKKRIGWWGTGCYIVRDQKEEEAHRERISDHDYYCQEIIRGPVEFATHVLFVEGRIVKALNIKYEFASDTPIKGQDTILYKVIHRCRYLKLFTEILQAIRFEGLCCVNYKVAQGQPFLLEINPRFGGSLAPYFFSFVRYLR
jgi:predicted ATP-grasp superfamily ATP-dependent carboligase